MLNPFKKKPAEAPVVIKAKSPDETDLTVRADVTLGDEVKEKVTGFTGIATSVSYEMDGTILVGVQPQALSGDKPADACEFDVERLLITGKGTFATHRSPSGEKVVLGAIYKDRVSGFEGTAIRRVDFLGGCTRTTLVAKSRANKAPETMFCAVESLDMVDRTPAKKVEETKTKTGGPNSTDRNVSARVGAAY